MSTRDRSFFDGGETGGIWEVPFKNPMTPFSLPFFSYAPLPVVEVIFSDDPPLQKIFQARVPVEAQLWEKTELVHRNGGKVECQV